METFLNKIYFPLKLEEGGPEVEIEELVVTENGTYNASDGKAYDPVKVDVPQTEIVPLSVVANGTYTPEEGKSYAPVNVNVPVVETESLYVYDNGTYTPEEGKAYDLVAVNVDTSGEFKDINFIDYDGTLLHSYTFEDVQALTELPSPPDHEGLTFDEWNWTLEELKGETAEVYCMAFYHVTDGSTKMFLDLDDPALLSFYLALSATGDIRVDWGDGSTPDILTGDGTDMFYPHEYPNTGDYVLSITPLNGAILNQSGIGASEPILTTNPVSIQPVSGSSLFNDRANVVSKIKSFWYGSNWATAESTTSKHNLAGSGIESVILPNYITWLPKDMFAYCFYLKAAGIPKGVETIDRSGISYGANPTFSNCINLKTLCLSHSMRTTPDLRRCYNLKYVNLDGCDIGTGGFKISETAITRTTTKSAGTSQYDNCHFLQKAKIESSALAVSSVFNNCYQLKTIEYTGDSVSSIGSNHFQNCYTLESVTGDFSGVTTINTNAFRCCYNLKSIPSLSVVNRLNTNCFSNCGLPVFDLTSVNLKTSSSLDLTVGSTVFAGIAPSQVILFATQEIAEVAKTTTNLVAYAENIHYVGEVY